MSIPTQCPSCGSNAVNQKGDAHGTELTYACIYCGHQWVKTVAKQEQPGSGMDNNNYTGLYTQATHPKTVGQTLSGITGNNVRQFSNDMRTLVHIILKIAITLTIILCAGIAIIALYALITEKDKLVFLFLILISLVVSILLYLLYRKL
jgi:hypothetical protein